MNRKQFLLASGTLPLTWAVGCGGASSLPLPDSLTGSLLLNERVGLGNDSTTRIVALRSDGTERRVLLENALLYGVSPDGRVLLVIPHNSSPRLLFLDGRIPVPISSSPPVAWSQDSQQLLFVEARIVTRSHQPTRSRTSPLQPDFDFSIYRLSLATGERQLLLTRSESITLLGWQDSETVLFTQNSPLSQQNLGTFSLSLATGALTKLSPELYHSLSPDGRYLLRYTTGTYQLWDLETKQPLAGTPPSRITWPTWSREGVLTMIQRTESGDRALQVRPSGEIVNSLPITLDPAQAVPELIPLVWSPDGKAVAYEHGRVDFHSLYLHQRSNPPLSLPNHSAVAWL